MSTLLIAAVVWLAGVAFATRFGRLVDTATSLAIVGFGGWIAIGALKDVHGSGRHRHGHSHTHNQDFSLLEDADNPFQGPEQQHFATDEGGLKLSVFERGTPPHFRLSGVPIGIARVETVRQDGGRQLFRFENCGAYWQSIEEIPEPHRFALAAMIEHRGHTHSFEGQFTEHAHGPMGTNMLKTTKTDPNTTSYTRRKGKGLLLPNGTPIFIGMISERLMRIGTTMTQIPSMW